MGGLLSPVAVIAFPVSKPPSLPEAKAIFRLGADSVDSRAVSPIL